MMDYCRLCAEIKDLCDIITSIDDVEQSIEQKLRACCQWTAENIEQRMPHSVCAICLDKLDKCWLFAQSVQLAQQKLHGIFEAHTPEIVPSIKIEDNAEDTEMAQITFDCPDIPVSLPSPHTKTGTASSREDNKKVKSIIIPLESHESIKAKHECPVCGRYFKRRWSLTEHMQRHSDNCPFECWLCHKAFKTKRALRLHSQKQPDNNCEICLQKFCTATELKGHKQSACEPSIIEQNSSAMELKVAYIKTELSDPSTDEPLVPSSSNRIEDRLHQAIEMATMPNSSHAQSGSVADQMQKMNGPNSTRKKTLGPFGCDICGRLFNKKSNMTKHRTIHTDEKPFECWLCHKTFGMRGNLKRHLPIHTICPKLRLDNHKAKKRAKLIESCGSDVPKAQVKHKCEECDRLFVKRSNMTEHYFLVHTNERPFECWLCHKMFRRKCNMRKHLKIHTIYSKIRQNINMAKKRAKLIKIYGDGEPIDINRLMKFGCIDCGKFFTRNATLKEHRMVVHSRERPFECWLCHKTYKSKKLLKAHMRQHLYQRKPSAPIEPSLMCELCGKSYRNSILLTEHFQSAHSDHRPYKCETCGMGFKTNRLLKSHGRSHTDIKYDCKQCEKSFRSTQTLKRHMEYHFGTVKKPFACDVCGKGFRLNVNLVEHRRIHTGEKPHSCEYCASDFRTISSYCSHMKKIHGISVSDRNRLQREYTQP